jgi:hypothetical protein
MKPFERSLYERTREALDSALGGAQFDAALSEGERLQLSDAVILASALGAADTPKSRRRTQARAALQ